MLGINELDGNRGVMILAKLSDYDSKVTWKYGMQLSDKSRPQRSKLLKEFFKDDFVSYTNFETMYDEVDLDALLCLRSGVISLEDKTYGIKNHLDNHIKNNVCSIENISSVETGSMSSSMRNCKADWFVIYVELNDGRFGIFGIFDFVRFSKWFEEHWSEFPYHTKENEKNGNIWHTEFRRIPLYILGEFRI